MSVFAVVVGFGAVLFERPAVADALSREVAFLVALFRVTIRVVGTAALLALLKMGT